MWLKRALSVGAFTPLSVHAVPSAWSSTSSTRWTAPTIESEAASMTVQGRLESSRYLATISEKPSLTNNQNVRLMSQGQGSWSSILGYTFEAGFESSFRRTQTYPVVAEGALVMNTGTPLTVYAGRKRMDWSEIDRHWNLTLWQPTFAPDTLRPEQHGLAGVFADWSTENFGFVAYASPFHIPNITPDIRTEDGRMLSDSRWRRARTHDYDFNGRHNTIRYDIDVPRLEQLVFQPGGAMQARIGRRDNGLWATVSAANKPVNEILVAREISKRVDQDVVDVRLYPKIAHHELASVDVGYAAPYFRATMSALEDRPKLLPADPEGAVQKLAPIQAYSARMEVKPMPFVAPSLVTGASYLRLFGGEIQDITVTEEPDERTMFDSRVNFRNAASFDLSGETGRVFRRPVISKFMYLYDWYQRGSLISAEVQIQPDRQWAVLLGVETLGVEDESYRPTTFLNQFRANDRVYGGMTYVF